MLFEGVVKKNILVVCPTLWDRRELIYDIIGEEYNIIFHDYDFRMLERALLSDKQVTKSCQSIIDDLINLSKNNSIHGAVSTNDYPGSSLASIIAQECNLYGPDPELVLRLQHKYYSRLMQLEYVPEAVPKFEIVSKHNFDANKLTVPFPVFVKPVKSKFSIGAGAAHNKHELQVVFSKACLPKPFLEPFNYMLTSYGNFALDANHVLIEEKLEGVQVTIEGFVYNSNIKIIGVVDSIMHDNGISFKRFEYPSSLPLAVQKRMGDIAWRVMQGIGYDNALFNIELMYNPITEQIYIIEVNPRMANQFADIYQKVDGTNTYLTQLKLATGEKPVYEHGKGKYSIAASFPLRIFENKRLIQVPTCEMIAEVYKQFPDVRVDTWFKKGQLLSEDSQDEYSFMYALIHLGARDKQELFEKYERALQLLPFEFAPINN